MTVRYDEFRRHGYAVYPSALSVEELDVLRRTADVLLAAALAMELLGSTPHLFVEQFVVKGPRTGAGFGWHQDSGYVGFAHSPYLTLWIALDEATLDNGCLYLQPRDLDADDTIEEHQWDEANNERIGYVGDDPGIALECAAGTIVALSSRTLHRSGPNSTAAPRRAYLSQYSPEPIIDPSTGLPKHFAKPLHQP